MKFDCSLLVFESKIIIQPEIPSWYQQKYLAVK